MEIIDISPAISKKTAVFPGDQNFERKIQMDFKKGGHLMLSSIQTTLHIGAHADAPCHYHPDGSSIESRDLEPYLGPCEVIELRLDKNQPIQIADLKSKGWSKPSVPRVLFKTDSFPNPNEWNSDFNFLSPELIDHLAKSGVKLIGIDTPSVDSETSKELPSHHCIFHHDLSILEGLDLRRVNEGKYFLIALPLKIQDADASPVRAVLIRGEFTIK